MLLFTNHTKQETAPTYQSVVDVTPAKAAASFPTSFGGCAGSRVASVVAVVATTTAMSLPQRQP